MKKSIQLGALTLVMSVSLMGCGHPSKNSASPSTSPSQSASNTNQTAQNGQTSNKTGSSESANSSSNSTGSSDSTHASGTSANSTSSSVSANTPGSAAASANSANSTSLLTTGKSGTAVNAGPLPGNLLIADRGNSRLLIVSPNKKILWSMTMGNGTGVKGIKSLGADDAFFTPDYKHIIVNEEDNQVIAVIDIATKKIVWHYGHAGVTGKKPGYLNTPDDAYMLPNGVITVADIKNMRILFINQQGKIVKQYGNGLWRHNPPASYASPNGDTPLPDGGMLITEINGSYANRLDKNGKLLYTVHFSDIAYPSDTQLLKNGNLLTVDYNTPGKIEEVTSKGKVVWKYFKKSGSGMLSSPSLSFQLPNGNIIVNDDKNDRVVVIDPKTNQIVWQYGHTGVPGTKVDYLNVPDGMDFLPPGVHVPGVQ